MDKVNRLLEHSARYFGLDGASSDGWDNQRTSHAQVEATPRRARPSATARDAIKDRDRKCSPKLHRTLMGRR